MPKDSLVLQIGTTLCTALILGCRAIDSLREVKNGWDDNLSLYIIATLYNLFLILTATPKEYGC